VTILALDTTSELGGVAVRSGGRTVAEVAVHAPDGFAHVLFPVIEQVLTEAGIRLQDIDCFAAASGPGSFTGVRVGLSAVKGLAAALGKPAVGVSNLKALASLGSGLLRATVLDARRNQVYAAVYNANLEPVIPEAVVNFSEWLAGLGTIEYELIGAEDSAVIRPRNLAPAVAEVAETSEWVDPALLDANYVRRSDAELYWREDS
jgi:tRNA threonylcarbamoyladenosine biosynthesis protein TsaB